LSTLEAAPLTVFIASYSSPRVCSGEIVGPVDGSPIRSGSRARMVSQRQLVRGLTFGAFK